MLVDSWLATAQPGFCGATADNDPGDCSQDAGGSWALGKQHSVSWPKAAEVCITMCLGCRRCRFVTVSRRYAECSWFATCALDRLQSIGADHRSGRVHRSDDDAELPGVSLRRFASAWAAVDSRPLLLALGRLIRPTGLPHPPHAPWHALPRKHIAHRFVSTDASRANDTRFVVLRGCPDEDSTRGTGPACLCLALHWFRRAAFLFPNARFLGKTVRREAGALRTQRLSMHAAGGRESVSRLAPMATDGR